MLLQHLLHHHLHHKGEVDVSDKNIEDLTAAKAIVNQAWGNPATYHELLRKSQTRLEAALQRRPDDVAVLTCLGAVLCDLHLHGQAHEHLARAISLGSTDWNTYFNAFIAMLAFATIDDARAMLTQAAGLEADPMTWQAYFDPHAM
ncbi:hypothetical protein [Burkholderia sp. Tr-20390]|uniref:hypothetical protein n=1 Tax=Burkholderia sp. Tr-20390 TaxID=2703904 RepID=UPI00197E9837|nr:hypothetical protein [Burkholderia sp. Tr-20390]MBN3734942.1 UDP-N-acetylglucosamine-peptide N-acetylglucosaminyltransferase [Burkholderia sp. Tr-20390]